MEDTNFNGSLEDTERSYFHEDHLGGTSLITGSTGTVTQIYDYYPYGSTLIDQQLTGFTDVPKEHSFTDKEYNSSLGLFYSEARWYNPTIGRFVSEDPMQYIYDLKGKTGVTSLLINPQAFNFYTYASNNPINLTDPTGLLSANTAIAMFYTPGLSNIYAAAVGLSYALKLTDPVTASLFNHSLALNPGDVSINEKNQSSWGNVVDKIEGSDKFQSKIGNLIEGSEQKGSTSFTYSTSDYGGPFRLDDTRDLSQALGTVNMDVSGSQNKDGSWDLNVQVTDTYHFNGEYDYGDIMSNIENGIASKSQDSGIISPYDETINFSTHHE